MQVSTEAVVFARRRPNLVGWSLAASVVALFFGASGDEVSWPPRQSSVWPIMLWVVPALLALAFVASRSSATRWGRGLAGAAALVALLAGVPSLHGFAGTNFTYPWAALGGIAALVVLGCLWARQFVVLGVVAGVAAYCLCPPLASPGAPFPRVLSSGGLTLTLNPEVDSSGALSGSYGFLISSPFKRDLAKRFDLDHIEVEGDAGPFTSVTCWPPMQADPDDPSPETFSFRAFVPQWVRSWNLNIKIRDLSSNVASIRMSVPHPGQRSPAAQTVSYPPHVMSVSDLAWARSQTEYPPKQVLTARVTFTGFKYSGSDGSEFLVLDSAGRPVETRPCESAGNGSGSSERIEMDGISGGSLKFLLTPKDAPSARAVEFQFRDLPNP